MKILESKAVKELSAHLINLIAQIENFDLDDLARAYSEFVTDESVQIVDMTDEDNLSDIFKRGERQ
jgi:hypothetical protein